MSYEEWYKKFVVDKYGKDKAEAFEKMINNKTSDKKQFEKYKEVLGKDSPKTLKDFQELKYNDSEEWDEIKELLNDKSDIKGFIKGIFNKQDSTKVISFKELPKKDYDSLMKVVNNAPDRAKKVFLNNLDDIRFSDIDYKDTAHYSFKEKAIKINLVNDRLDKRGKGSYTTIFHEIGHLIDTKLGRVSTHSKLSNEFKSAIIEDVNSFIEGCKYKHNINSQSELYSFISSNLKEKSEYHSVSDIFGGVTGNRVVGKFKHDDSYWKRKGALERETFAHLFEATMRNDKIKLEMFKNILPNAYEIFIKLLNEV